MFAAINAASLGADVTLFEPNARLGKKLAITGKGRCNVTNRCSLDEFLSNVPANPKFLYSALSSFSPEDTISFFEGRGVPLKVERGNRVFPVSDKAGDIVRILADACRSDVTVINEKVTAVNIDNGSVCGLSTKSKDYSFDAVILATGGKSYPLTGSDGSGYSIAAALGHTVVPPFPALVPMEAYGSLCRRLQGLSLKNVSVRFVHKDSGKTLYEDLIK